MEKSIKKIAQFVPIATQFVPIVTQFVPIATQFVPIATQFVPIILIFLLLSFSKSFAIFSFSILGKLLAVLVIIFYTYFDKYLGLFVCAIVLLYYQSDYLENMLNIDDILDDMDKYDLSNESSNDLSNDLPDDGMYLNNNNNNNKKKKKRERMINQDGVKQEFRERNCKIKGSYKKMGSNALTKGGKLIYKDMTIKSEYAEHIFPELEFIDEPCNPCNESCKFSIIESKLNTEILMIPVSTSQ
uniref:Uncharacterized protein n=1 Tax=viral metagenome TaxID=1070528 RepID=A0A6C0JI54_9ZZZZ